MRGADATTRGDHHLCGVPGGSIGAREVKISLLLVMVAGIQSGLRALTKILCQVEAVVDSQGKPIVDSEGRLKVKTPNPRVELPYTYLMAWYVMHCPSLMIAVSTSEGFVPFVQWLESSNWSQYYMFYVRKAILSGASYKVDQCFPRSMTPHIGTSLLTLQAQTSSCGCPPESSGGLSISSPDT